MEGCRPERFRVLGGTAAGKLVLTLIPKRAGGEFTNFGVGRHLGFCAICPELADPAWANRRNEECGERETGGWGKTYDPLTVKRRGPGGGPDAYRDEKGRGG